jgi:predicted O-methyltransferase YrrM
MNQPTVYTYIEHVYDTLQGWCSLKKAQHLAALVHSSHSRISVEIGVHAGKSAIPMAIMHSAMQHGKLIAIDAWAPDPAIEDQNEADKAYWGNPANHEQAKSVFIKALDTLQLHPFVEVFHEDSNVVAVPDCIDVLHIDGNHGEQTIRDVQRWVPHVRAGGFVVMDDLGWSNNKVEQAVTKLEGLGFEQLIRVRRNLTENVDQKDDYGVWQSII